MKDGVATSKINFHSEICMQKTKVRALADLNYFVRNIEKKTAWGG